jgi:hypothetical protein
MRIGLVTCEPGPGRSRASRSGGSGKVIPTGVGVGPAGVGSTTIAGVTRDSGARVGVGNGPVSVVVEEREGSSKGVGVPADGTAA